jgi:hypothetical protein
MLIQGFILAIAVQGLGAVDDANLALTTCGFAAFRSANEQDQTPDQFARTLSSNCSERIAQMRRAIIALETGRGKSTAAASAAADALIAQFRSQFASDYAKRAESEAQLRELERALRAEGKSDAQ